MTRRMVAGADFAQWRNFGLAAWLGDGTTRVKGTTARRMNGRGQLAGEENAPAPGIRIDDRHGGNESLCVWMFGEMANRFGVARLDDPAKIHDEDPPADVFDDGDVVRDEQAGHIVTSLEVLEKIDDLRLNRDVEGADRFVAHHEPGLEGERAGDADPLPLPAAQLVRISLRMRRVHPHFGQQSLDSPAACRRLGRETVDVERFADNSGDGHARVQRTVRILENHLKIPPARPKSRSGQPRNVFPSEQDLARGGLDQPDDRPAQGGLAAAAFADETNGFAWRNGQADIVHGPHDVLAPAEYAVRHGEMDFEIANFEQIHAGTSDSEPQIRGS